MIRFIFGGILILAIVFFWSDFKRLLRRTKTENALQDTESGLSEVDIEKDTVTKKIDLKGRRREVGRMQQKL